MADILPTLVFYAFAGVLVLAALAVITAKNPVHAVLWLIFAFFNAAGLFLLIGAEYLAMTLVIVYVGAVAVLFLFVVMMLNVNFESVRSGLLRYLPVGAAAAAVIFAELLLAYYVSLTGYVVPTAVPAEAAAEVAEPLTNTEVLGQVLYTQYVYAFQVAGLILLVAMIGAIVLTLRHKHGVHRQRASAQVMRARGRAISLVNMKPGQGV